MRLLWIAGFIAFAIYSARLPDAEISAEELFHSEPFASLDMIRVEKVAPRSLLLPNGTYNYGRFRGAIAFPELHSLTIGQRLAQRKNWEFLSITINEWMIGVAIADMGYVGSSFVYFYNAKTQVRRRRGFFF